MFNIFAVNVYMPCVVMFITYTVTNYMSSMIMVNTFAVTFADTSCVNSLVLNQAMFNIFVVTVFMSCVNCLFSDCFKSK